jgi:hypothetical protein
LRFAACHARRCSLAVAMALLVTCPEQAHAQAAAAARRLIVVAFDAPDTLSFSVARRVATAITNVCARGDLLARAYEANQLVPTPEGIGHVDAQTFYEVARISGSFAVLNVNAREWRDSVLVVGTLHFVNRTFGASRSEVSARSLDAAVPILACGLVADVRLR